MMPGKIARLPRAEASRWPVRVWIFAAVGAVALHAGGLGAALVASQPAEEADELGTNAIEVGYEREAPRTESLDLPAGPDADASAAAPAVAEQKEVVKDTDLPQAVPTDTEDPDRIVSPDDKKKPIKDQPDDPAPPTAASAGAVATEATALPSSQTAAISPRSVAPELGTGDSAQRVRTTWVNQLAAHFNKYKRYPTDRANKHAEPTISFAIDRTGHVLSASIATSSGDTSFDEAALAMIQRADPLPPPPPLVADEGLTFQMPVEFRVSRQK